MFFVNTFEKSMGVLREWGDFASHQIFNTALFIGLVIHEVLEISEKAASDIQLWMKVIRSNSIN